MSSDSGSPPPIPPIDWDQRQREYLAKMLGRQAARRALRIELALMRKAGLAKRHAEKERRNAESQSETTAE